MYALLWVVLLLKATHREEKFMHDGGVIIIKAGQLLTGRDALARDSGISPSTVERILKYLENEHQIEQQKTTKYRVITILNWDAYQKEDSEADNKWTTNGQQMDTFKNVKNVKNVKKIPIAETPAPPFSLKHEIERLYDSPRRDLNLIGWYFEKRSPDIRTTEQFTSALRRHLRAAKALSPFSDDQLAKAWKYVATEYPEWTLDTLVKKLSK